MADSAVAFQRDPDHVKSERGRKAGYLTPEVHRLILAIRKVLDEVGQRMTIRQIYYKLEAKGIVKDGEYKKVGRAVKKGRKLGSIKRWEITDRTRRVVGVYSYDDPEAFYADKIDEFHLDYWKYFPIRIEIWVEKDALVGALSDITNEFQIDIFPCRGYPSDSFVEESVETLEKDTRPVFIGYIGDANPTGMHIEVNTMEKLRKGAIWEGQINYQRLALNPTPEDFATIRRAGLRTYSAKTTMFTEDGDVKKKGDPRTPWYIREYGTDQTAQAEALDPHELRRRVRSFIEDTINREAAMIGNETYFGLDYLKEKQRIEQMQIDSMKKFQAKFVFKPKDEDGSEAEGVT